jgi:hypothetical protein
MIFHPFLIPIEILAGQTLLVLFAIALTELVERGGR